jgi:L-fucose mutarotase
MCSRDIMLKNIDPVLGPELLRTLAEMGHGDEVAVVDANFTARRLAGARPLVRLDGVGLARVCRAILSVFPLDEAVAQPVAFMRVCDTPEGHVSEVQREVFELLRQQGVPPSKVEPIERFAFYQRLGQSYAIVQTGELRPYGNFVFKKGVILGAAT